jgi:hypothetical protein
MQIVVIFVTAVAALGALAVCFGSDSRASAWSGEQEYAERGYVWGDATLDRRASATSNYRRHLSLAVRPTARATAIFRRRPLWAFAVSILSTVAFLAASVGAGRWSA